MRPAIFLISGTPGAGKSSVAHAIATQSGRGVRISVDDIRDLVVAGRADPVPSVVVNRGTVAARPPPAAPPHAPWG